MANVDENVVQMTFDNVLFEKRLADTVRSLDNLRLTIEETSSVQGLADIGKDIGKNMNTAGIEGSLADLNQRFESLGSEAGREFNVAGISSGIESVSRTFLALSSVALTVIRNITDRAVDAGISIARSLSFDQVNAGFGEYELNINSIQTILANTKKAGTTLGDVTGALDELNEYADKTIYNFAQMTQNIGSFTAQGVELDTAVASIKGISNAAAIAGSNSAQAGAAMYNLAQAIGEGSLRLMNWNSVVNAGMGGTVMQEALFTTGKAMQTLEGVTLETTFQEWQDAGNNFRDSLQDGWITAEVLTTTLEGFSGDFEDAELAAKGFTDEMIADFRELGDLGVESATKVRTFSQLMDTAKEAVASGWSQSFRIMLGDFNQATDLFTDMSEAFGSMVGDSAEGRNQLLQGWVDLGGRANLIDALRTSFYALGRILDPIQESFRQIFPRTTAQDLQEITRSFALFAQRLIPSGQQMETLKEISFGFFSALKIGWTIIKEVAKTFVFLGQTLKDAFGGTITTKLVEFSNVLEDLMVSLVIFGGIEEFFQRIRDAIANPREALETLRSKWEEFVTSVSEGGGFLGTLVDLLSRVTDRVSGLSGAGSAGTRIWDGFKAALSGIVGFLDGLWETISTWFSSLGTRIAENMGGEGQFDSVLDAVNTGLIAAIAAMLVNFSFQGIDLNFFSEVSDTIGEVLDELTGVLAAMQTRLQSDTLSKLAIAIGILAASVMVLSLIDSAALTKALTAMAVGFGQLVGAMTILAKLSTSLSGFGSMAALSLGLILLASAVLILAIALKIMSTIPWEQTLIGLGAVVALLGALVGAAHLLQGATGGMVRAGAGILLLAGGLFVLAMAMKIFATMSWEEIGKGLAAVAGSLIAIAGAMRLMPKSLPLTAAGLVLVGGALNLIAGAMKIFATMGWEEIGKGLAGVAGSLLAIAGAMHLMPANLPLTAAGLVLIGFALGQIALAVLAMGSLSLETMGKGIGGLAAALIVLAIATNLMSGAIMGALAIAIVSGSLVLLAGALAVIGQLSIAQIVTSLVALAATLAIFGLAAALMTPVIPMLLALGGALLLLGAAFLLIGAGAALAAAAFATFAGLAGSAIVSLLRGIGLFLQALPGFLVQIVEAFAGLLVSLTEYAPQFFEFIQTVLGGILDTIIEMTPQVVEAFITIVGGIIDAARELIPDLITLGFDMLMSLLEGIRDNVKDIAIAAGEIVVELIKGLNEKVDDIIDAGKELIISIVKGVGEAYVDIFAAGAEAIIEFLAGVASNVLMVIDAGFQIVIDFLNGLADSIEKNRGPLADAGFRLLDAISGGILTKAIEVFAWFAALPGNIVSAIGDALGTLVTTGRRFISGLINGIGEKAIDVYNWFTGLKDRVIGWVGDGLSYLYNAGIDLIRGLWNGIYDKASTWLKDKLGWLTGLLPGWVKDALGISSPSKVFAEVGKWIPAGLAVGIEDNASVVKDSMAMLGQKVVDGFHVDDKELTSPIRSAVAMAVEAFSDMDGIDSSPIISPVLDLTNVRAGSKELSTLLRSDQAYNQALAIAQTRIGGQADSASAGSGEIKFEQNIFAPEQLSASDIYKNTRTQIAMAKEELKI